MLIKDYTYSIGKFLPTNQREDIALEVETTIYEQLIAEYGKADYTDEQIEKVIYALGSPKKVAEAYMGKPYTLINSQLIPIYWMVVKFTLLALTIVLAITGILETTQLATSDYLKTAIQLFSNIWDAGLSTFGMITIIFMLISKKMTTFDEDENWSIKSLSKYAPEKHRVKIAESVATIVFTTLGLIWINYFKLGVYYSISGDSGYLQLLDFQMFKSVLIYINLIGGLNIALNLYLLVKGEWQLISRCLDIFITFVGLAIFAYIVFKPGFIDFSVLNNITSFDRLKLSLQITLDISVIAFAIAAGFQIWHHLKALFFSPTELDELNQKFNK